MIRSKVSGTWKLNPKIWVKVNNNYRPVISVHVKVSGAWKLVPLKDYGFFGGGWDSAAALLVSNIEYINVNTTTGNATSRGNLTVARRTLAGVYGGLYGFFAGGYDDVGDLNTIDYIDTTLTTGNASDKGDLTGSVHRYLAGVSNLKYGFFGRGTVIDYIDVTTITGNATSRGSLSTTRSALAGVSGQKYGFYGGGDDASGNIIDYIDMSLTTGNAIDRGDLTLARNQLAGAFGLQYGFFAGGYNGATRVFVNVIDYIDMELTTGNAIDKGDLTVARGWFCGTTSHIYGFFGGGWSQILDVVNIIDYIDVNTTTGNALDKGDMTNSIVDHGGI